jgi:hypothetical protein
MKMSKFFRVFILHKLTFHPSHPHRIIKPFHSFNLANRISKRGEQLTLGEGAPVPLGLPKLTFVSLSWLLLIPIDLPQRLPDDLLGLCICCFVIAGFKGAIKLSVGLVDARILSSSLRSHKVPP